MPSLCSGARRCAGYSRGTMNDLIAARPEDLSSVAHTTMWAARTGGDVDLLAVDHVLVAVEHRGGRTAAESEPNDGSVIAIAATMFLPSRSSCSSAATGDRGELPSPGGGPTAAGRCRPRQISMGVEQRTGCRC